MSTYQLQHLSGLEHEHHNLSHFTSIETKKRTCTSIHTLSCRRCCRFSASRWEMRVRAASAARFNADASWACCRALRSFTAVRSAKRRLRASCSVCACGCMCVCVCVCMCMRVHVCKYFGDRHVSGQLRSGTSQYQGVKGLSSSSLSRLTSQPALPIFPSLPVNNKTASSPVPSSCSSALLVQRQPWRHFFDGHARHPECPPPPSPDASAKTPVCANMCIRVRVLACVCQFIHQFGYLQAGAAFNKL